MFYLESTAWTTILPALVFLEFDFFVREESRFNGNWSDISFFLWGKVRIYSKLGSEIRLWDTLQLFFSFDDLVIEGMRLSLII